MSAPSLIGASFVACGLSKIFHIDRSNAARADREKYEGDGEDLTRSFYLAGRTRR